MNLKFFNIFLKTYLKSKTLIICFLLLPISLGLFITSLNLEEHTKLLIGIHVTGEDYLGIIEELIVDETMDFEIVDNKEWIYDSVTNGVFDIGYIFDFEAGFNEQINKIISNNENYDSIVVENEEKLTLNTILNGASLSEFTSILNSSIFDISSLVTVVKLEGDFYYKYINNVIFSVVFEKIVPYLGISTLNDYGIYEDIEEFKKLIDNYSVADNSFHIEINNIEHSSNVDFENNISEPIFKIIKGIICIYLVILSLISLIYLNIEDDNLFKCCMSSYQLKLNIIAPIYFIGIMISLISLIVSSNLISVDINLIEEVYRLIMFQISLLLFSIIFSKFISKEIMLVFIPFVVLFILVTHPIFIDLQVVFPILSNISWILNIFSSYIYLSNLNFILFLYVFLELIILSFLIVNSLRTVDK